MHMTKMTFLEYWLLCALIGNTKIVHMSTYKYDHCSLRDTSTLAANNGPSSSYNTPTFHGKFFCLGSGISPEMRDALETLHAAQHTVMKWQWYGGHSTSNMFLNKSSKSDLLITVIFL